MGDERLGGSLNPHAVGFQGGGNEKENNPLKTFDGRRSSLTKLTTHKTPLRVSLASEKWEMKLHRSVEW